MRFHRRTALTLAGGSSALAFVAKRGGVGSMGSSSATRRWCPGWKPWMRTHCPQRAPCGRAPTRCRPWPLPAAPSSAGVPPSWWTWCEVTGVAAERAPLRRGDVPGRQRDGQPDLGCHRPHRVERLLLPGARTLRRLGVAAAGWRDRGLPVSRLAGGRPPSRPRRGGTPSRREAPPSCAAATHSLAALSRLPVRLHVDGWREDRRAEPTRPEAPRTIAAQ